MGVRQWHWTLARIVFTTSVLVASCTSKEAPIVGPFDHAYSDYARLLNQYVTDAGWVNYAALSTNSSALSRVASTLEQIPGDTLSAFSTGEKLAFWINAYNIVTLLSIVESYPVTSIKDIPGVWDDRKWTIAGQRLTLNEIEHDILRKDFTEPRIHFAINCASVGCPPLLNQPYRATSLDSQLAQSARRFLLDPIRNEFFPNGRRAELSELFNWFGADFGGHYATDTPTDQPEALRPALNFIADVLPDSVAGFVNRGGATISFKDYDWNLNSTESDAAQTNEDSH